MSTVIIILLKSLSDNMVPSFVPKLVCVKSKDYRDEIKNADLKPSAFNDDEEMWDYIRHLVPIIYDELEKYKIISNFVKSKITLFFKYSLKFRKKDS